MNGWLEREEEREGGLLTLTLPHLHRCRIYSQSAPKSTRSTIFSAERASCPRIGDVDGKERSVMLCMYLGLSC